MLLQTDMKKLTELTKEDGIAIITYLYPNNDNFWFISFKLETSQAEVINEDGKNLYPVNYSVLGITYQTSQGDNRLASFTDIQLVSWLYSHGFDISQLIHQCENQYVELENLCDTVLDCSYSVYDVVRDIQPDTKLTRKQLLSRIEKIKKLNYYKS